MSLIEKTAKFGSTKNYPFDVRSKSALDPSTAYKINFLLDFIWI